MWSDYDQDDLNHVCSWDFYPHICDLVLYVPDDIEKLQKNRKLTITVAIVIDIVIIIFLIDYFSN